MERAFDVHVSAVNTAVVRGKVKRVGQRRPARAPAWKKAVVTLRAGDQIEIFQGV